MVQKLSRAVVLYSGRWYVRMMHSWVKNHMDHLIIPLKADVVVIVAKSQLHCGTPYEFESDVQEMFGSRLKRLKCYRHEPMFNFTNPDSRKLTPYKWSMLTRWFSQFNNVAKALELAGPSYDVYIRARIDVAFESRLPNFFFRDKTRKIFAIGSETQRPLFSPKIKDRLYVADFEGMKAIVDTSWFLYNYSERCFQMCPEEQVAIHAYARNYSFALLSTTTSVVRTKCHLF